MSAKVYVGSVFAIRAFVVLGLPPVGLIVVLVACLVVT